MSLYRILSFVPGLLLIYAGHETAFVVLFTINQITDILDGYIARKFNQSSPEGALLDSYADLGSYVLAIYGISHFHSELWEAPWRNWLLVFVFLYFISYPICYMRYRQWMAGLHLYSSKITGYLQGGFLVMLFVFGLWPWLFYLSMGVGILAELEVISINLISPHPIVNARGWYWILKDRRLQNPGFRP